MKRAERFLAFLIVTMMCSHAATAWAQSGSWFLPSSAYRGGQNGAEFHTDVRIMNLGTTSVTVTATFYDQASGQPVKAAPFPVTGRTQASFDNILQSLFGKPLSQGAYGPIRFDSSGPIVVSSSVNNVNACGSGATSGQWLPGISASDATTGGAIAQLAVSASGASGYRTNLVVMNPATADATVSVIVRSGAGVLLSKGTIGPLPANGFSQVALDSGTFPGVAGRTDTNLWAEFTSDQPVLAFASVINNASGDPFAVVATLDALGQLPTQGAWDGTWAGSAQGHAVSFDVVNNQVVKIIYGGSTGTCVFDTFLTPRPGWGVSANGSFTFNVPSTQGVIGITGTGNLGAAGSGSGLYSFAVPANSVPGSPSCAGSGTSTFLVYKRAPAPARQSWDGTWAGSAQGHSVSFDLVNNQVVKLIYGGSTGTCVFDTFLTPQPGWVVDGNGSFSFDVPSTSGAIGVTGTGNLSTAGSGSGLYRYAVPANSVPGSASCTGSGYAGFLVYRVGGAPPHP